MNRLCSNNDIGSTELRYSFAAFSDSMKSNLISWIRPLHYIWQIFGFAYFDDGLLRFFQSFYFLLVLTSSFSCLYMTETWLTQFRPGLFDARLIVMSIATQWHEVYPLVSLIRYRVSSAKVRQLIEFANYLCVQRLGLRSGDYAKMLLVGIAIFGQFAAVVYAAVTYLNSLTGFDSNPKLFFCTIKSSFSVAFPALQFVWWILLFRYLFVKSKNELLENVACAPDILSNGTSVSCLSRRVQHSLDTIKDIIEMKRRITCHYGSFVLLYPVGWLTALLHTCSLLSSDVGSVHVVILLVHAIASLFQFYLPFFSCQIAIISNGFHSLLRYDLRVDMFVNDNETEPAEAQPGWTSVQGRRENDATESEKEMPGEPEASTSTKRDRSKSFAARRPQAKCSDDDDEEDDSCSAPRGSGPGGGGPSPGRGGFDARGAVCGRRRHNGGHRNYYKKRNNIIFRRCNLDHDDDLPKSCVQLITNNLVELVRSESFLAQCESVALMDDVLRLDKSLDYNKILGDLSTEN